MCKCEYCNKEFKNFQGLAGHKSHCKLNPNYNSIKHKLLQLNASKIANQKKKEKARIKRETEELTRKERILICKNCGKEYKLNLTDNEFSNQKYSKFCSRSCANTRHHHKKTKEKISQTLKNTINKNIKYISDILDNKYFLNLDNYSYKKDIKINLDKLYLHKCTICKREFYGRITKYGNFAQTKQCCDKCQSESNRIHALELRKKEIAEGKFKGWKSRNILSYPEKFWIGVLTNNNIKYIVNKPIKQEDNIKLYFLDFYIEKDNRKIDLEIDGKQHKYNDRYESDIKRDKYLKSLGYEVYRIEWNSINNDKGKKLMKEKIDKFIKYYNNII